jgi:hypothetical protein
MQTSDWISIASIFVALLSALYARHAVGEARKANEIALHNEKLRIYKGVLEIHGLPRSRGVTIKERDLFRHYEYIPLSEFYFNPGIYEKLKQVFNGAWEIVKLHDLWEAAEDKESKASLVEKTHAQLHKTRNECTAIEEEMKNYLRLAKA